jgi:signal transduction histidine kinase
MGHIRVHNDQIRCHPPGEFNTSKAIFCFANYCKIRLHLKSQPRDLPVDLLDLTTIQAGVLNFDFEKLDLSEVVENAVGDHFGLCQASEISIDLRLPASSPAVHADRIRLAQLLGNLLSNAIKHSPKEGVIIVEVSLDSEVGSDRIKRVSVSVSDEGPGVPDEQKEQIFQEFYRGDNKKAGQEDGTGLGLAISQKIAATLGGIIWVEDGPSGKDAKFVFEMPAL